MSNVSKVIAAQETAITNAYAVVKKVVDKHDPETLLKMGAPGDEYDPISKRIAEGYVWNGNNHVSETGLAHIIAFQWHYSFGEWTKPVPFFSLWFDMAREIITELQPKA